MHHTIVHARRPTLAKQFKDFIKMSKALLRAITSPSATYYTSTYKGNELLLARYGIYMHMSANIVRGDE